MKEKDLSLSKYIDIYGPVLDERQHDILDMYYNEDYSLSEIAEILSITRQGVCESIKKAKEKIFQLDIALNLIKKNEEIEIRKNKIIEHIAEALCGKYSFEDIINEINDINL